MPDVMDTFLERNRGEVHFCIDALFASTKPSDPVSYSQSDQNKHTRDVSL
jgi:hypothetical protein